LLVLACAPERAAAEPLPSKPSSHAELDLEALLELARGLGRGAAKGGALGSASALDAAAEASFLFAEKKRLAAERITLQPYKGGPDRKAILAYVRTEEEPWVRRKSFAIRKAEVAYLRVFGVEPPPPPPPPRQTGGSFLGGDPNAYISPWDVELSSDPLSPEWQGAVPSPMWAIAAAARVGMLWGDFMETYRSMPIPPPAEHADPAAFGVYFSIPFDTNDEIAKQRAKKAFVTCLRLGKLHMIADENTRAAEAWLARYAPAEYARRDELEPLPVWTSAGLIALPAPLPAR
jgi:hypothetical protein